MLRITRTGLRGASTPRTVSSGSSARTVPMPAITASQPPRSAWASRRASSEVIHCDSPPRVAMAPSSDSPAFNVTCARPRVMKRPHGASTRSASRCSAPPKPSRTSTPAAARARAPWPATLGFGSRTANTTRRTPARRIASVHGAVRPTWLHGSSVTKSVAARARSPAPRSATTSAWSSPARR